jgi:hypothetical protein
MPVSGPVIDAFSLERLVVSWAIASETQ